MNHFRLPLAVPVTSGSTFKNLGKANKVVAERKKKLEESKLNDTGVRIAGTLWQSEKNKLTQVNFSPSADGRVTLIHFSSIHLFNTGRSLLFAY